MRKLGIIEEDREAGPGSYRFANEMYPVYFWLEQLKRTSSNRTKKTG